MPLQLDTTLYVWTPRRTAQVELALWDISSSENYFRLRPLIYAHSDVFIIVHAIDEPESLRNVWKQV